ncbi:MAG: hypothetical protein AABW79_04680 [Nanoarchaeota archaeon]
MRAIESFEVREKRSKRNRLIMGVLLIGLMVLSTAGYAFYGVTDASDSNVSSGGIRYDGSYWIFPSSYSDLYLFNDPTNIVKVNLNNRALNYGGKILYIDSEDSFVREHLALNLGTYFNGVYEACYGPCLRDLPEKDCSEPIIIYRDSSENSIRQEQNCFFINGDTGEVDKFILSFTQ